MLIISIIGALAIVIGVSYAWFTLTLHGTKNQVIKSGYLELKLDESASNGITLDNAMPITDAEGKNTTSYKFTLKNTGTMDTQYQLKLTDQAISGTRMPDTAVKYWLKTNDSVLEPQLLSRLQNRSLDNGVLKAGESISYELKVWIDYDAANEVQGTKFNAKINVTGKQIVPTDEGCFTFSAGTITKYKCYAGNAEGKPTITNVVIPNKINGVAVTNIGEDAFYGTNLESVVLPDSLISIGNHAFRYNLLSHIIIPDSVTTLSQDAFSLNRLTSVELPNGLTTIGGYAFESNQLTNILIPDTVTSIGSDAFAKNQLTNVIIKGKSSSADFTSYPSSSPFGWASGYSDANITWQTPESCFAFSSGTITSYKCYAGNTEGKDTITNVMIPETIGGTKVTKIGSNAFDHKNLTNVIIPDGITSIGSFAFYSNQLTTLTIPPSVISIDSIAFESNNLTKLTLSEGLRDISMNAFHSNKLTEVTIPSTVSFIGIEAFSSNLLTSVNFSEGIKTIEMHAFEYNKLTNLIIPSSVTSLYDNVFYGNQLKSVTIKGKSNSSAFSTYGSNIWGWAAGYGDSNITWQP